MAGRGFHHQWLMVSARGALRGGCGDAQAACGFPARSRDHCGTARESRDLQGITKTAREKPL
jgi:hypothetical protein